jgi:hypothetical protein
MKSCVHGRSEKQQCKACNELNKYPVGHKAAVLEWAGKDVVIDYNNATGSWIYSVSKPGGYWLDSFLTRKAALDYIKRHNLKLKGDSK